MYCLIIKALDMLRGEKEEREGRREEEEKEPFHL